MLSLQAIQQRIHHLEQTIQRNSAPAHLPVLPPLPETVLSKPTSSASASSSSAAPATSPAPTNVLSQLIELSTAFKNIVSQHNLLQQYLSQAPTIHSLIDSSPGSSSSVGVSSSELTKMQEEVVLSATPQFEQVAAGLQQLQALLPVLDNKWPMEDFPSLHARLQSVQSALPRQAFSAAQQHVSFEHFLREYQSLLDLINRQFLLWNQELQRIETEIDTKIAMKKRGA